MRFRSTTMTVALALSLLPLSFISGDAHAQSEPPAARTQEQLELTIKGDKLIGKEVMGIDGKALGEIKDVIAAESEHQIAVIIETGDFLGMGARLVSVPMSKLRVEGDLIGAELTREQAADLPEYKTPAK